MIESRKIEFSGASGGSLAARLDLPAKPRAFALFAHCFTCGKDIFAASRINEADPVAAWAAHNAALRTRRDWLERLAGTGVPCAASHIAGWGTIEPGGDGLGWRPL